MANALFTALAKAQAQFPTIVKNRKNYNKGEYADLTAILNAIKAPLLEHGIIVIQSPVTRYLDNSVFVVDIVTTIAHGESGETYEGVLSMPTKNDAQSIGSAITYGRRYALVSMLSLSADDDDDGEEATKPAQGNAPARQQPQRQAPPVTPTNGKRNPAADMPERMAPSELPHSRLEPHESLGNGHKPTEAPKVLPFDRASGVDTHFNAVTWAMDQGKFNARPHAENSYKKLSKAMEYKGAKATTAETDALLWAWVDKVNAKPVAEADAELWEETPEPVTA